MMQTKRLAFGLWPVMLTPFLHNNEIDYKTLKKLTEFYIKHGAAGLFSNCLSSEMFQLTDSERIKLISTVVKIASQHNVQVVATGTFSNNVKTSAEFIKKVFDTGVAAVVIITNQFANVEDGEEVLKNNLGCLIDQTGDIPLGVYECPYPYKRLVSPALMKWIGQSGKFLYIKDTSCNTSSIQKKLTVLKKSCCSLFNANTATSFNSIQMGAGGLSPIGANFYPELYSFMMSQYQSKQNHELLDLLNDRLSVMEGIAAKCYPYSAKLFLNERNFEIGIRCRIQHENMRQEDYLNLKSLKNFYQNTLYDFGLK